MLSVVLTLSPSLARANKLRKCPEEHQLLHLTKSAKLHGFPKTWKHSKNLKLTNIKPNRKITGSICVSDTKPSPVELTIGVFLCSSGAAVVAVFFCH